MNDTVVLDVSHHFMKTNLRDQQGHQESLRRNPVEGRPKSDRPLMPTQLLRQTGTVHQLSLYYKSNPLLTSLSGPYDTV